MAEKRVIEQVASNEVHNDDWFLKDSPTQDTSKISATNLKAILGADGTLALEEIANAIAEEYNPSATYNKGAYVFYEGAFYKCTQNSTTGTWDSSKWNITSVINLINSNAGDITELEYKSNNAIAMNHSTIATYNKGDYVFYWFHLYRCLEDDVYGAWDDSKWEEVNILEYIDYVLENAGQVQDVKVDGTSVVTNKVAEIEIPVKDVQVKTDSTYDSVVDASGNAKIDLSSVTAYGEVPNLPQAIATFKDGADAPMKSLKIAIEPVQDLHGYDSPWVGGAGKNKLPLNVSNIKANNTNGTWSENAYTESGVTFTLLTDNGGNITGIKTNGTASANIYFVLSEGELNWITFDGSYIINGCSNGSSTTYAIQVYSNESSSVRIDNFNQDNYIQSSSSTYTIKNVMIVIRNGYTASNLMFYPMIRLRSVTDATFAPYSNICPISGWSEANVTRAGKNLFAYNNIAVYTYDFLTNKSFSQMVNPVFMKGGQTYVLSLNDNVILYRMRAFDQSHNIITEVSKIGATNHGSGTGLVYYDSGKFYGYNGSGADGITVFRPTEDIWFDMTVQATQPTEVQFELGDTPTSYSPYNGSTYTIDLDGTRYGGTLDVVSGVLTVDRVEVIFDGSDDEVWQNNSPNGVAIAKPNNMKSIFKCNEYKLQPQSETIADGCIKLNGLGTYILVKDIDRMTVDVFKPYIANNPIQLVYELATPTTIQLTPTQVKSLLGSNNVWADTGDIDKAEYQRDATTIINELIARIEALEG